MKNQRLFSVILLCILTQIIISCRTTQLQLDIMHQVCTNLATANLNTLSRDCQEKDNLPDFFRSILIKEQMTREDVEVIMQMLTVLKEYEISCGGDKHCNGIIYQLDGSNSIRLVFTDDVLHTFTFSDAVINKS